MTLETHRRAQSNFDSSEHPDYHRGESDAKRDRAIDDATRDGDVMLKFLPAQLLRAFAELCEDNDMQDAARELLRPIYKAAPTYLMGQLYEASRDHPDVRAVAAEALAMDAKHMRGGR